VRMSGTKRKSDQGMFRRSGSGITEYVDVGTTGSWQDFSQRQ